MTDSASIEWTARRLCEDEWQRCHRQGTYAHLTGRGEQVCPVSWLLPDLLALIAENHDRPVSELAPTIRRLILEYDFFEDAGDPMVDECHDDLVDEYVALFVNALEQVRRRALEQGEWSNVPVTPQMFG